MIHCPRCDDFRPLRGRCNTCKRNEYYLAQGAVLAQCKECSVVTRLYQSGTLGVEDLCRPCMKLQGLRKCTGCGETKGIYLDFQARQSECRQCRGSKLKKNSCWCTDMVQCGLCLDLSGLRRCRQCVQVKPKDGFYPHNATCKTCVIQRQLAKRASRP